MSVRYVFWDSDNTLVKTHRHHWAKHVAGLKAHGIDLDPKWEGRVYTNNGAQNWEWMSAELGLSVPREQYLDEIDDWYFRHIGDIAVREGVTEALDLFAAALLPMAVVSNGRRRSVLSALEAKNLSPRFRFILCKEDYTGRKPDAAPYLAAKTRMQQIVGHAIDPQDCLVIEDDPLGVQAGLAAGMKVIDRPVGDEDTKAFLALCKSHLS